MHPPLRPIAVHVEEQPAGQFRWMLTERGADQQWSPLDRAAAPAPSYQKAMAQGLQALESLVDNLDAGPRAAATGPQATQQNQVDPPAGGAAPQPAYFGFGPAP